MSTVLYLCRMDLSVSLIFIYLRENCKFWLVEEVICWMLPFCVIAVPQCCRQAGWVWCHMNLAGPLQPRLETRWYGPEIMSVKERVKRCTHAQIFCTLKRQHGLAERSCYSIRTWTSANGRREEVEIMRVGTQLSIRAALHYLWSLLISCQSTTDDCRHVGGERFSLQLLRGDKPFCRK